MLEREVNAAGIRKKPCSLPEAAALAKDGTHVHFGDVTVGHHFKFSIGSRFIRCKEFAITEGGRDE